MTSTRPRFTANSNRRSTCVLLYLLALLASAPVLAGHPLDAPMSAPEPVPEEAASDAIVQLLQRDELPTGVVFELIENDRAALSALLPEIRANIAQLRERDPDFPIAVVSHGAEQFSLARGETSTHPGLHRDVEALVRDEGVNVEVCGTFAEWRGIEPDAFAGFVEVTANAPDRLDDYRSRGYEVIRLRPSLLDAPDQDPWQFDFGTP